MIFGPLCGRGDAGSEANGNEDDEVCEQSYNAGVDVAYIAQRREDGAQHKPCAGQICHDGDVAMQLSSFPRRQSRRPLMLSAG